MPFSIRAFCESDLPRLKEITVEAFSGVSIDQNAHALFGEINGHDWRWRKARHLDDDTQADSEGIFVAEAGGTIVGYITTWIDREAGIGHIPNLALDAAWRGKGLGRTMIEHALEHFRREKVPYAKIETLDQNPLGYHLYTSMGFQEVARQVHFIKPLFQTDTTRHDATGRPAG